MDGIFIIILVIVLCHFCLYLGLRNKLNELLIKGFPPINVNCGGQSSVAPATHAQFPGVSVTPAPATEEELVAVMIAAVAAHESEMTAPASTTASVPFGAPTAEETPARVHAVEKTKNRGQNQRWTATARYENHKRL